MTYYKRITIFENRKRSKVLSDFKALVRQYWEVTRAPPPGRRTLGRAEPQGVDAEALRTQINAALIQARSYTNFAGIGVTGQQLPAPAVGGYIIPVDLFTDVFRLAQFPGAERSLVDSIDRAIGVYDGDVGRAKVRTFNPFWWIGRGLAWIAKAPFMVLGAAGFDSKKIEESFAGKLIQAIVFLAQGTLAVYGAYRLFVPEHGGPNN